MNNSAGVAGGLWSSPNSARNLGPLSGAACDTIADFAAALARQALSAQIWRPSPAGRDTFDESAR